MTPFWLTSILDGYTGILSTAWDHTKKEKTSASNPRNTLLHFIMVLPRNSIKVILEQPLIHDHVRNLQSSSQLSPWLEEPLRKKKQYIAGPSQYLFTKENLWVVGNWFNEPQLKILRCQFEPICLCFLQNPGQTKPNTVSTKKENKRHARTKWIWKEYGIAIRACSSLHLLVLSLVPGTFHYQSSPVSWNCPSPSAFAPSGSCSPARSSLLQIAQSFSVFLPPSLLPFASRWRSVPTLYRIHKFK